MVVYFLLSMYKYAYKLQQLYVKYVLLFEMHEREYRPLLPIKLNM